jgi:dTDP-4-amino-4,6-dideoxygalactose transaminase
MYRGNELMAAVARAQLARLPERTAECATKAAALSRRLVELPGVLPPLVPGDRTSVHHKFRVRLDPQAAGVELPRRVWRNAVMEALRAEGLDVVHWQTDVLPAQTLFQKRRSLGEETDTDLATLYDPERFPRARRLLEGSLVLFAQSCPLIGQDEELVAQYADAFARVWRHRDWLARWARERG